MTKGVYSALSGAVAAEVQLDTIAQNLANAGTSGYQRLRPIFREALADADKGEAVNTTRFAAPVGTVIDLAPGVMRATGRELDVVPPEGSFFCVSTDRGERFTKSGALDIAADGTLRAAGRPILDDKGQTIVVPEGANPSVSAEGDVLVDGEALARIKQVSFREPSTLAKEGALLFSSTASSGAPEIASGNLRVGELEESNANPVVAMTELLSTSRLFDAFQRAIDTFRDADRRIVKVPE